MAKVLVQIGTGVCQRTKRTIIPTEWPADQAEWYVAAAHDGGDGLAGRLILTAPRDVQDIARLDRQNPQTEPQREWKPTGAAADDHCGMWSGQAGTAPSIILMHRPLWSAVICGIRLFITKKWASRRKNAGKGRCRDRTRPSQGVQDRIRHWPSLRTLAPIVVGRHRPET